MVIAATHHLSPQTARDIVAVGVIVIAVVVMAAAVMLSDWLYQEQRRRDPDRYKRQVEAIHDSTLRRMWDAAIGRDRDVR